MTLTCFLFIQQGVYRGGTGLSSARAADLRALRFVLQRMDELDDAMRVRGEGVPGRGGRIVKTREDLAGVVRFIFVL